MSDPGLAWFRSDVFFPALLFEIVVAHVPYSAAQLVATISWLVAVDARLMLPLDRSLAASSSLKMQHLLLQTLQEAG